MDHKPLLRTRDAAEQIACSRSYIYDLVARGHLCRHFIGEDGKTRTRVCQPSVDAYLAASASPIPAA